MKYILNVIKKMHPEDVEFVDIFVFAISFTPIIHVLLK